MYIRGDAEKKGKSIILSEGQALTTDTYFGCFHCSAYTENTSIRAIQACVEVKGSGVIELRSFTKTEERVIAQTQFNTEIPQVVDLNTLLHNHASDILYLRISGNAEITRAWYEGVGETKPTKIAIIICTYQREDYVLRNLRRLSRLRDTDPDLKECFDIYCVDNGRSLTNVPKGVKLIKNRNYGGSGGYARGMIEASSSGEYTHFWLMDDDIRFDPSIVCKAVSFIRHRKNDDLRLAAGMFSFEKPSVQQEATAIFNGYTFISNAGNIDFRFKDNLLKNHINQDKNTYGGWWSLVIPITKELPMPFFIKMDDVEHGLRCQGKYAVLNGFGVWHEAFGKKANAWSEYYTTRNTLITQALHPDLPRNPVKMMGIRLLKALAYDEPKCMEAVYRGLNDYISGTDWLHSTDPETRHKKIIEAYHAPLAQDMSRKIMLKRAAKNMFKTKNLRSIILFFKSVNMFGKCKANEGWRDMTTESFWRKYLGV